MFVVPIDELHDWQIGFSRNVFLTEVLEEVRDVSALHICVVIYLYTYLMLYIINITKTSQNFFDNKIFEIIPDITKITDINNITDELLIKLFKLDDADLVGYEEYKKTGEGRLDAETIQRFKQFNIYEASAATKIQAVARGKQTRNKKPKTTGGKTRRKRWF